MRWLTRGAFEARVDAREHEGAARVDARVDARERERERRVPERACLLYTSDAADDIL